MNDFIFLHGGGQGSWVWEDLVRELGLLSQGTARMFCLDVPGCGEKRGRDTSQTRIEDIVSELIADIERAGIAPAMLVGHSQAGCILPFMAGRRPDLFSGVVYLTCSIPQEGRTVVEMIGDKPRATASADTVGWPCDPEETSFEERFRVMFCNDMEQAQADAFLARLGSDQWPMSSYMHCDWDVPAGHGLPVAFIVCLKDVVLPVEWQRRFAARFGADTLVEIDAAHQAMTTRPRELAEILLDLAIAQQKQVR